MSIITLKQIQCDGCDSSELDDGLGVDGVWKSLAADGWTRLYGEHHCPACSNRLGRIGAPPTVEATNPKLP